MSAYLFQSFIRGFPWCEPIELSSKLSVLAFDLLSKTNQLHALKVRYADLLQGRFPIKCNFTKCNTDYAT